MGSMRDKKRLWESRDHLKAKQSQVVMSCFSLRARVLPVLSCVLAPSCALCFQAEDTPSSPLQTRSSPAAAAATTTTSKIRPVRQFFIEEIINIVTTRSPTRGDPPLHLHATPAVQSALRYVLDTNGGARQRHLFVLGNRKTGKSTLLDILRR